MIVQRVAVVGAGTMGAGIAQLCASCGFSVKIHDPAPGVLTALPARLKTAFDGAVLKGKLTTQQAQRAFHAVSLAESLEELAGADLVIEAVPEMLPLKQKLFETLSRVCPDAILATNTSSLSVASIMAQVNHPQRAMGIHFFNPPVSMKLVEMIRTPQTSPDAFQAAWDFVLAGLRRTPVDVKDVPGFIVNRVMRPYYVASQRLPNCTYAFGALDEACRRLGKVPMGPFELMDLIGLDTNFAITTAIFEALGRPERFTPPALQRSLIERGFFGRKSGAGFYLYQEGRKMGENPEALKFLAEAEAHEDSRVWKIIAAALTQEAELLVSEGTASATDVDTAIKYAMNFPRGPLEWRNENMVA